jgi:hypothetical protein
MRRSVLMLCLSVLLLSTLTFAQDKSSGPRCVRQACSAALKDFKGTFNGCHASYVQLEGQKNEVWLVAIDTGSSKVYRGVDAVTGDVLGEVDPAKAKRCGPRPFHCPDWVYQACPE